MKKYYPGIDLFKFIFSLLVVCIHVNPLADVNYTANLIVSGLLASFAVPYFFVVSGYMSGDKSLRHIIKKPLYLCLFCMSLYLIMIRGWKISFIKVLQLVLLSGGYYHLWYLVVLLYCMIICKTLFENIPSRYCVIICVFTYLLGCLFRIYLEVNTTISLFLFRFLSMGVPFFYYGMCVRKNRMEKKFASLRWGNCLFILLWLAEVLILMKKGNTVGYTLLFTTFPMVAMIFSYAICLSDRITIKTAPILGRISMIIYCIHPAILLLIQTIARKMGIDRIHSLLLFCLVSIISCLIGLVYNIILQQKNNSKSSVQVDR